MEFDMQRFLTDMKHELSSDIASLKKEMKEDSHRLEGKVDDCLMTIADHELRVTVIEQTPPAEQEKRLTEVEGAVTRAQRSIRWVTTTVIGGAIAAGFSYMVSIISGGK
jgi:hypothetical protein